MIVEVSLKVKNDGGIVVFLPSFKVLERTVELLKVSDHWKILLEKKGVVLYEPRQSHELERVMGRYLHSVSFIDVCSDFHLFTIFSFHY